MPVFLYSIALLISTHLILGGDSYEGLLISDALRIFLYLAFIYILYLFIPYSFVSLVLKNKTLAAFLCYVVFVMIPGSIPLFASGVWPSGNLTYYTTSDGLLFEHGKLTPEGYNYYIKSMWRDMITGIAYLASFHVLYRRFFRLSTN